MAIGRAHAASSQADGPPTVTGDAETIGAPRIRCQGHQRCAGIRGRAKARHPTDGCGGTAFICRRMGLLVFQFEGNGLNPCLTGLQHYERAATPAGAMARVDSGRKEGEEGFDLARLSRLA